MKLLRKYRTYTYTGLCFVILIGFLSNYFLFKYSNHTSADEIIQSYRKDIEDYAKEYETLVPLMAVNSKFGNISQVCTDIDLSRFDGEMVDTLAYDYYQDERIVYRKSEFVVEAADGKYVVRLMLPTIEEDMLIGTVAASILIFCVLFILFTTLIDHSFSQHIFRPFNNLLEMIKTYNLEKRPEIRMTDSDIDEFRELNRILATMTKKINEGYFEMKEFVEYTSHELQTPLSVIQLKLEALSQMSAENPEMLEHISSIESALRRAIRFNRSILLIAKIRNDQYADRKEMNLTPLIRHYIAQYEEMLAMRKISVEWEKDADFRLHLHPLLAEHLVQNVVTNAIKHNCNGGKIGIRAEGGRLTVTNTFRGDVPEGNLFEKYTRSADKKDSNGLGLNIVRTICMKNNIGVKYEVKEGVFVIGLSRMAGAVSSFVSRGSKGNE